MNRNIITETDAKPMAQKDLELTNTQASVGIVQKADTYFDRLSKYVPIEIIGAYLLIEGLLMELLKGEPLGWSLFMLFFFGMLATWFFARQVLKVVRTSQLVISAFAFFVWVFATGGWFATLTFWAPGWGTIAVVVFAVIVRIAKIDPLPNESPTLALSGDH